MTQPAAPLPRPVPQSVSEQARAFLATPPPTRPPYPSPDDPEGWARYVRDAESELAPRLAGLDTGVALESVTLGGVATWHAHVASDADADTDVDGTVYLDIHGGALIIGGGEVCRLMAAAMAHATGEQVWSVDYRMPPDHPFPAGLDDCCAVYRALLEAHCADRIVVGGISAGANLAAALVLRALEEGLPVPRGLALMSPELDLTESGDTSATNLWLDPLGSLMPVNLLYAAGHDLAEPHLSPLFGDVTGFPPTLLTVGTRDLFLSNAVRMHRKLRAAGVDAQLHVFEAMPHGGFGGTAPEDAEPTVELRRFLHSLTHD
jgi:epsilon-lactone hydrolase